jgi:aryl-alcohol dehydrogenase-like predicted oxidoreductase
MHRAGCCDTAGQPNSGRLTVVSLRLMDDAAPGRYFDDQLAAMAAAREGGLIGGVGLSSITPGRLRRALAITGIACVQNLLNLAGRRSMPVLGECHARGSLSCRSSRSAPASPAATRSGLARAVAAAAARLRCTPAQVALAWLLDLRPEVLLIPARPRAATSKRTWPSRTPGLIPKPATCPADLGLSLSRARGSTRRSAAQPAGKGHG